MRQHNHIVLLLLISCIFTFPIPAQGWVGFEFDGKGLWATQDYIPDGSSDGELQYELTGRFMLQEQAGDFLFEGHLLGGFVGWSGTSGPIVIRSSSPFRSWDLETFKIHGDNLASFAEVDRLLVTLDRPTFRLTAGRQAVTWGNAFYYNVGDLFGAFPITDISRLHKPGIDALALTLPTGTFSELSAVAVPSGDETGSAAANFLFPAGEGTLGFVGGSILDDTEIGTNYSIDYKGTKIYSQLQYTDAASGRDFGQFVLGAQRQLGMRTHFLGEFYYNGWGSTDPSDYTLLRQSPRFSQGRALTVGRWETALDLSYQISPLLTGHSVGFINLTDPSMLLRLFGLYNLSDLSSFIGGVSYGFGAEPEGFEVKSEYGGIPLTFNAELIVNF
ncbi:hypothetical protein EP232_05800 [bacterium]|nr:MAG: hypothetical protein EP232_05800 [bacterium]